MLCKAEAFQKTEAYLNEVRSRIQPLDKAAVQKCRNHWNSIAKPLYGLGLMEDMIVQTAGIQKTADVQIGKRTVVVMCADNGITEERVTQSGSEITALVSNNIADGKASVNHMAACAGADVLAVDIGIKDKTACEKLLLAKTVCGTRNFLKEPAMSEAEMLSAIRTGVQIVESLKQKGVQLIVTGEMGIANTTTSSAVAAVLLGLGDTPERVTGRGAGLDDDRLSHKMEVIYHAIQFHGLRKEETLRTLQCVGGLDICGLVGILIGGALYRLPVILDGVITAAAALAASRLVPETADFMFASHAGREPAMELLLKELGKKAVIQAELALGEGTGGVMLLPLLDMALSVYRENATFQELSIDDYKEYQMR